MNNSILKNVYFVSIDLKGHGKPCILLEINMSYTT